MQERTRYTMIENCKYKLTIQGQLSNLNDYTKACRGNKYQGSRMKKSNEQIITAHIWQQLRDVHIKGKVRLTFNWYEPNRKRDIDNVCFAKKFILDALVSNQTIEADGWRCVVGFNDNFFVDKDNPRIEVFIEQI